MNLLLPSHQMPAGDFSAARKILKFAILILVNPKNGLEITQWNHSDASIAWYSGEITLAALFKKKIK